MANYCESSDSPLALPMLSNTGRSSRQADGCFVAESEQKWHELQATERKRRALLKRTGDSFFSILFSYEGTFWRIISRDLLLWFTIGVYVLLRLLGHLSGTVFEISSNQIAALGAVMTNRFDRFFQDSVGAQGRIFDTTTMLKAALPFERGIRIVRYLNSAYILGYVGLSGVYSYDEFFVPLNRRYNLLTDEEYRRIRHIDRSGSGSDTVREVIAWCITDVHAALKQGYIDPHTAQDLRKQILQVRGNIADMYDHYDQPLLFIYVHFIVILTAIYLPLAAVYISQEVASSETAHWFNDVIGLLALLLQCIFVIGVRYVAQVMRVPYAGELESLPVLSFVEGCSEMSLRIMYSAGYQPPEYSIEQDLTQDRESIGDFWDSATPPDDDSPVVAELDSTNEGSAKGRDKEPDGRNNGDMEFGFAPALAKTRHD